MNSAYLLHTKVLFHSNLFLFFIMVRDEPQLSKLLTSTIITSSFINSSTTITNPYILNYLQWLAGSPKWLLISYHHIIILPRSPVSCKPKRNKKTNQPELPFSNGIWSNGGELYHKKNNKEWYVWCEVSHSSTLTYPLI